MDLPVLDPPAICFIARIDLALLLPDSLPLLSLSLAGDSFCLLIPVDNLDYRIGPDVVIAAGSALLPEASPDHSKVADEGNAEQMRGTGPPGARAGRDDSDDRKTRYDFRQRDLAFAQPEEESVDGRPGSGKQPGTGR